MNSILQAQHHALLLFRIGLEGCVLLAWRCHPYGWGEVWLAPRLAFSTPRGCKRDLQTQPAPWHHRWGCRRDTPGGSARVDPARPGWSLGTSPDSDDTPRSAETITQDESVLTRNPFTTLNYCLVFSKLWPDKPSKSSSTLAAVWQLW